MKMLREELLQVESAFVSCDHDGSGSLSKAEFERALDDEDVALRKIFQKYNIDINDASELFGVLDWDCTGEISVEELVQGIAKIQDDTPSTWDALATHAGVR